MDKITHKFRRERWTAIINECLASGMKKTAWCKANVILLAENRAAESIYFISTPDFNQTSFTGF